MCHKSVVLPPFYSELKMKPQVHTCTCAHTHIHIKFFFIFKAMVFRLFAFWCRHALGPLLLQRILGEVLKHIHRECCLGLLGNVSHNILSLQYVRWYFLHGGECLTICEVALSVKLNKHLPCSLNLYHHYQYYSNFYSACLLLGGAEVAYNKYTEN